MTHTPIAPVARPPQEDGTALNRCYSALLTACFSSSPAGAGQLASSVGGGADLTLLTRVLEGWASQLQAANCHAAPATPEAYEATAAVRMLGQRQYTAGERPPPMVGVGLWC